jgi:hypothetical protein
MPASPQPDVDLLQLCSQPLPHGVPQHDETSLSHLPADVRETEEVEGVGLAPSAPSSIRRREATEFDEAGLFGVQFQCGGRESLAELVPKPRGFPFVLEGHDEVVSIADDDHVAFSLLPPVVDPEVKRIVQEDVRKEG